MLISSHSSGATSEFDFQRDVLEASHERPVLIDFWAPWCGPCQVIGPLLEKLEAEAGGAWTLIKINTDEHPALAQQAGVRGIPTVKLIIGGRLTAEFTGALPEPVLRRWLEEHMPSETKALVAEAQTHLNAGRRDEARLALERLLSQEADHEEGRLLLARIVAFNDLERARELVRGLEHRAEADAVLTVADYLTRVKEESDLPDSPAREPYVAAAFRLGEDDVDGALTSLIEALQRDRYYDNDGPRKVIVALFQLLGEEHEVTQRHRPGFNRSLY